VTEYVIARSSENAPQGNTWSSFEAPSVASVGTSFDVVFRGGTGTYTGVFVDRAVTTSTLPPSTLITTLDTITIPGLGSNLSIAFVSQGTQPGISSGGHTVFDINVALQTKQVLLTKGPSASDLLRVVSYEGMPFSGTPSGNVLVTASPRGIAPNGDVGFRASSTAAANGSGMFRWSSQTSALQLVAHTDQDAPPYSNKLFNLIAHPTNQPYVAEFGATARSAFRASMKTSSGMSSGQGIWVEDPVAGVAKVADTGDFADGTTQLLFTDFHAPAVNSAGEVAFRGCLSLNCSNDGIWTGQAGFNSLVALNSAVAPLPDGSTMGATETFADFSNPVMNENGDIAFRAVITGEHPEGIWRRASQIGAGLRRVVLHGDLLRGTNLEFVAFGPDLAISDTGELAFTATMSDDPHSTLDDELALLTTFQLGNNPSFVKIVKVGEAFDFTPTLQKVVANILFYPGAYPMGTTGFIHVDSSPALPQAIGFALTFDDSPSSRALVLSTVE
jgi:hypothetical protein